MNQRGFIDENSALSHQQKVSAFPHGKLASLKNSSLLSADLMKALLGFIITWGEKQTALAEIKLEQIASYLKSSRIKSDRGIKLLLMSSHRWGAQHPTRYSL